jgi:DNA ligase (NAD+)
MSNTLRIAELESSIKQYSQAYYDGEAILGDEAFDKLVAELRQLDPTNPLLKKTASGYENQGEHLKKLKHMYQVGSLDKIKIEDAFSGKAWKPNTNKLVASVKVDGGSSVAYYAADGNLMYVLSRGDGEMGLDITQNCVNVPKRIAATGQIEAIRGELAISWEDFESTFEGKSHPRNAAVGISQSLNSSKIEVSKIRFIAYTIYNFERSKLEMLHTLETQGFEVVPYTVFESFNDFISAVKQKAYEIDRENLLNDGHHIPVDGTVLTENNNPENQIAIKFADESGISTILGFEWATSRTGRVVPVALIEPLNLSGAIIRRINCSNISWLKEMQLYPGCKVEVIRANCIIPCIIRAI